MSESIQLEFKIDNRSPEEMKIHLMQQQIENMQDSMSKIRRKLFSEVGELKKLYSELMQENEILKSTLETLKNDKQKTTWNYEQEGYLFDVQQYKKA